MSIAIDGLLFGLKKNVDYAQRLVADLSDEQMTLQPAGLGSGERANWALANHPAWILSHLNAYIPVMIHLIRGEQFPDPKQHPFGMQSRPELNAAVYAPKAQLIGEFVDGHNQIAELLSGGDDQLLMQSVELERWKPLMPTVGIALPYLLLVHENQHFGQLSAWRRVLGLPSV